MTLSFPMSHCKRYRSLWVRIRYDLYHHIRYKPRHRHTDLRLPRNTDSNSTDGIKHSTGCSPSEPIHRRRPVPPSCHTMFRSGGSYYGPGRYYKRHH